MEEYLYKNLSYSVVGAAIEVHRLLGPGFPENVYEQALSHELTLRQIPFARQVPIVVQCKGLTAGNYRADLALDEKIYWRLKPQ
jgi:GxxExxY protein